MTHTASREEYEAEHQNWWAVTVSIPTGGIVFRGGLYGNNYFAYGTEAEVRQYVAEMYKRLPADARRKEGTEVTYRRPTLNELVAERANEAPDTVSLDEALDVMAEATEVRHTE